MCVCVQTDNVSKCLRCLALDLVTVLVCKMFRITVRVVSVVSSLHPRHHTHTYRDT